VAVAKLSTGRVRGQPAGRVGLRLLEILEGRVENLRRLKFVNGTNTNTLFRNVYFHLTTIRYLLALQLLNFIHF
jgi:hypothetical protein